MLDPDTTFSFASLFEQREQEIEASKRSPADISGPQSTSLQELTYHVVESKGEPSYILETQGRNVLRAITPDSAEGKKILDTTWRNRSLKSVSVTPTQDSTNETIAALTSAAREQMAVSGRVSPHDLVPSTADDAIRQAVLSKLAPECVIETYEGKVQWLYSSDNRRSELSRLKNEGRLAAILNAPLVPTDRFGLMLRALLRHGANLKLEELHREDLLALSAAMEATSDIGLPQPDAAEVRKRIGRDEFLSDYDVLLERGFVGREDELKKLRNFVQVEPVSSYGWSSLVLTGLGGSGKSTLLAKFAREVFKESLATVVILDFDRPGIHATDTFWLEQEICRQVGHQYPETDEFLRQRRIEEREYRSEYINLVRQSSVEAAQESRTSRGLIWSVKEALVSVAANTRPFLLVLDTFEQIDEQDSLATVLDWLYDMASPLSPVPLKVIFSGRLFDSDREQLETHGQSETVVIDELKPNEAEQLLLNNGIPEAVANRLSTSDFLPRRPLELTLLAKITQDLDKTVEELEQEMREGGDSAKELFAGLVYRRVLRRLGDDTAEQLAYPGLVLRYVTADLIQEVLVPALRIPPFDEDEANRALDKLASVKWLAYRQNGEVWHRSDLRRSTLKAMIAAEPEPAKRISEEAVKYFEKQPEDRHEAEAVYHRLMLMHKPSDGDDLELGQLSKAATYIGPYAADLPPAAATLLKFAVNGRVPADEVECLPERYLASAYGEAGKNLVSSRQFGKALKLFERFHGEQSSPQSPKLESWEIKTLFSTATWDLLPISTPGQWEPKVSARTASLGSINNVLYPAIIVSPKVVAAEYPLSKMLQEATRMERLIQYEIHGSEDPDVLREFLISLVYCVAQGPITPELKESFDRLNKEVKNMHPPVAPVPARRLVLLERAVAGGAIPSEVTFSIKTMKLDRAWVQSFKDYFSTAFGMSSELDRLLSDLQRVLEETTSPTARKVLGAIDAMSTEEGKRRAVKLVIDPNKMSAENALKYLRGPNPEFHDPCRFALLEAFPDRSSRRRLGEIIASLLDLNADDLNPDSFVDALAADPEHALEVYVELVDRAWSLGTLMSQAEKETVSSKLNKVSSAYKYWDDAVRAVIVLAFPPKAAASASYA